MSVPVLAVGAALSPAQATTPAPTGLAPDSTSVDGTPVFSWTPVAGTNVLYDVQVYDGSTLLTSVTGTVNDQWVPSTVEMPTGHQLSWQVRAAIGGVDSSWSIGTFTRNPVTAPTLVSPSDGQTLSQPGDPLAYRWNAVPGAVNYTVEVGPDPSFVDPVQVTTYTSTTTSLAPNLVPPDGTYYWRVTANLKSGVKSDRSQVYSYVIQAVIRSGGDATLPSQPQYPAVGQTIDDLVLDWNPIDGATTYRVQVSTDSNFLTNVLDVAGIKSSRYSPATTLNNDQYWWRVAPVNVDGVQTPWSSVPVWSFTRRWPDQATLEYPADGASVGDPLYYQWSPVRLASSYTLDISTNSSFTPASAVTSCSTVHTTYTPSKGAGDCWPAAAGTYYWRVRAFDGPANIASEVVNGQVHSFSYNPGLVTLLSPANNSTISTPTMSWSPYDGADSYKVTLTNTNTAATLTQTTVATTITWPTLVPTGPYRWQVQPVFSDGRIGASLLAGSQPTFTLTGPDPASASSPNIVSTGPDGPRPPLLTWMGVSGATNYRIQYRLDGSLGGWSYYPGTFAYTSGNDITGVNLNPGTYDWQVEAYNGSNFMATSLAPSTYTITPFATVTGYRDAITGGASGAGPYCNAQVPANCVNLRQTPVLRWDPVLGAATYTLLISHDPNLTNPVLTVQNITGTTMWMDTSTLPDADAGTAYYWEAVPCGPTQVCATPTTSTHQFNKQSLPVVQSSPADGATVANDITFTWQDYLTTIQADDGSGSSLSTPARTEARQYRIQVSTLADFSTLLDDKTVDQRSYTPTDRTYPEQTLYWRVQAIDGSLNPLPWSTTRTVIKQSPVPVLTAGINNEVLSGSPTLGWAPTPFAKTYNVQLFPAGVNPDLSTPLQQSSGLKQNSWTPTNPLAPGDYQWRVRRADADGRFGQWSTTGLFTSSGSAPTLVAPDDATEVSPRWGLFTWLPANATAPVSTYRVQLTRAEGGSPSAFTTIATAYAPTARLADGHWTWTVTALDTQGQAIGTSVSRSFIVAGTLTPTGAVTISGTGHIGTQLLTAPVSWNQPGTTTTYQWYRGSNTIAGATDSTYTVQAADVSQALKVKVIGVKPGYDSGTGTFSNTITGTSGQALVPVNNPSISGSHTVGATLTAQNGTWNVAPTGFTYQWLRSGSAIAGATGQTYHVVAGDAALALSVRVTASRAGYTSRTVTSGSVTIAKDPSSTSFVFASARIHHTQHAVVTVTVSAGLTRTGTVRVYNGTRLIKSVTLTAANGGRLRITLPLLAIGTHSIQVRYSGNSRISASSSAHKTLTVVR